ncbi:MAG: ABC transporter substrate-binding protein [Anaerolineae bacterium]|nr:ABC transporter substrate-binding protein [Anaerolineae bacterium]
MKRRRITRRDFLRVSAVTAAGVLTGCATPTPQVVKETVVVEKEVTVAPVVVEKEVTVVVEKAPEKFREAPMLAERVAAGTLPPVGERLPVSPAVVGGRDAIGEYGGDIRMIHLDPVWMTENYDLNAERMLHYSDIDLRTIVPNILESWEVGPDGKAYTIHMRQGMKWSDGQPLTTEDVRFWWEDFVLNTDLTSSPPWQFRFGGEPMQVEVVDDYTVKFTHAATFGNFPAHLTRWEVPWQIIMPAHYYKQFHASYTDQAKLDAMAAEMELEGWAALFSSRHGWGMGHWQAPDHVAEGGFPVIAPWWIVSSPAEGLFLWERNPYYWKVDLAGNQLPYIDTMRFDYVVDAAAVTLKIVQGELDIVGQHSVTMAEYPLYKENEARSNYVVGDYLSCMSDRYVLFPQHYLADDPVLTEIVNHPNFVKALSVAIDREEINESLFFGTARMGQISPMPMSKYYKEKYGTAWAQYDPALAGELLDEMGLDQRDSDGFRLRPDGERLKFNIEHAGERVGPVTDHLTEMIVTQWLDIGIDATTKQIQESLYNERMLAYQVHCGVWHADRCTDMLLHIQPQWFFPTGDASQGTACAAWVAWFEAADRTAEGIIEPPDEIKRLYDIFDQMTSVVDEDERVRLGQQIFDWLADNPLEIGLILESPCPLLFNKNMRNLPRPKVPMGWDTYGLSTYHPEAFFYEGGKRF